MKNVFRALGLSAVVALSALPALAQTPSAGDAAATSAQDEQAKADLYNKWLKNRTLGPAEQKVAYEAGKEYLSKYGSTPDQYSQAVSKWIAKYEQAVGAFERQKRYTDALQSKNYPQAFAAGKEILGAEPQNTAVIFTLASIGYDNVRAGDKANKSLYPESINFARRALELIEQGKASADDLKPFNGSRDEAAGFFNYLLGLLHRETAPDRMVDYFLKVAQGNSAFKNEPTTYLYLGNAYVKEHERLVAEFNTRFPAGTPESDESRLATARLNQVIDRIIDAYARAVAVATKLEQRAFRDQLLKQLTVIYKERHNNSDAGLNDLIANVRTQRLPLPTDPAPTIAPASTPATTPASGTGNGASTGTTTTTAKPTAPAAGTTAPKPAAKPTTTTGTPSTAKPPVKPTAQTSTRRP